jgi:hypothetical protein
MMCFWRSVVAYVCGRNELGLQGKGRFMANLHDLQVLYILAFGFYHLADDVATLNLFGDVVIIIRQSGME